MERARLNPGAPLFIPLQAQLAEKSEELAQAKQQLEALRGLLRLSAGAQLGGGLPPAAFFAGERGVCVWCRTRRN